MRGCLQVLAGIVAIFFILVATMAVIVWPLGRIVTNREAMLDALSGLDEMIVETAPRVIAQTMMLQAAENGLEGVMIDSAMVESAMDELLPPGWVAAQVDETVNTFYDVLETGRLDDVTITVDTAPVIEQLKGPAGGRLVATVVEGIPHCTEPLDLNELLNEGTMNMPACVPPEIPQELLVQEVHTQFVRTLDENPQLTARAGVIEVPLSEIIGADTPEAAEARQQIVRVRRIFLLVKHWGWLLWVLPVLSLLLIAALVVRSVSELGHWWGWPLMLTALLVFPFTLILPAYIVMIAEVNFFPAILGSTFAFSVSGFARAVAVSITEMWRSRVYLQAGVMLGVGLLLISIGFFTKSTRKIESRN